MTSQINFKGTRWLKCDLHLHTTESICFRDQSVTPEQWVQRATDQGLDCVAVTDHNSGNAIDRIKTAAVGTGLAIFPGVEITCDTSKIHLLILFDVEKGSADVNDFLIRCGIDRSDFANADAFTSKNIFDVAEIANKEGALIIPAHIDEYNGLGDVSVANLEKFYSLDYINAVQVVHKDFLNQSLSTTANTELKDILNAYYSQPTPSIDDATIKKWFTAAKYAVSSKLAVLTFSDNPHDSGDSKHGLDGIGSRYTWIKMDEHPTLEGLRQAILMPKFRIRNDFSDQRHPYEAPDLWIRSITITGSHVTHASVPLHIEFNPQLTTIIGGRGSGKSSILRFIRGLFNRTLDISGLNEIISDHNGFYKKYDPKTEKGVIKEGTIIVVEFVRNRILHKITATVITDSSRQVISIEKYDQSTSTWLVESADGYIDFLKYEHYSQKQIYEIAQKPNSLRERIDRSVEGLGDLKNEREVLRLLFLEKSAAIRTKQEQIAGKGRLQTEITDLNDQISMYQQSGIAALLMDKEKLSAQKRLINDFVDEAKTKEELLGVLAGDIVFDGITFDSFEASESVELEPLSQGVVDGYNAIKVELIALQQKAIQLRSTFELGLTSSSWANALEANESDFEAKKAELAGQGMDDITRFEALTESRTDKSDELARLIEIETSLSVEMTEREGIKRDFFSKIREIFQARKDHVENLMQDDKINVTIVPFRDKGDFFARLRGILQKPNGFESDIDQLADIAFSGNTEQKMVTVKQTILDSKLGTIVTGISGYFRNLAADLTESQMDEIELFWPEDEISIKYKPSGSSALKPLSTASAGQKTTAILTIILSQGTIPLLLDQPEDDLDNRLVYELIVDRLNQAKEYRQIIVVTHNANIPVNGDAEYIHSMNSESKKLSVLHSGTVEDRIIKKEICDVMEGTEYAFDMRSKRYKSII
jgi:ABC-type Mn2+/Zn2+ transport system ATPase subunit